MRPRHLTTLLIGLGLTVPAGCASARSTAPGILSTASTGGGTSDSIGRQYGTMTLTSRATDASYGYSEKKAVPVGGGFGEGGHNVYRYLNSLLGPAGEVVRYNRVGTCCSFRTANSPFGDTALLEIYEVEYEGIAKPVRLYFNWYDSGAILIPSGFTAWSK